MREKIIHEYYNNTVTFPVKESFYSLQGEGHYSGIAAYFIRLGGCHIKCNWCDTKTSWKINKNDFLTVNQIIKNINSQAKIIVITGGEPTMWNLSPLTKILKKRGYRIHVETSGTYPIQEEFIDWITISPKKKSFH
ncbi:7-carboxy-7-deazaguanine synthase QueE [Blattabacterium cuenoti]|uniref:7-carboxy-7-deazaguanine synthase QueE n=1 Tax=Blattabacterium cuenoti TaxID=1653831 RepID=UPI00374DD86C